MWKHGPSIELTSHINSFKELYIQNGFKKEMSDANNFDADNDTQGKANSKIENKKKHIKNIEPIRQNTWNSIAKNYEMIEGAQLSNSFIILMALDENEEPLNTTQISEIIAVRTRGHIYKISATLKDALEHRLKREGYVKSIEVKNKSLYTITPKGRKLLNGWIAFLNAFQ